MKKITLYKNSGTKTQVSLPKEFGLEVNKNLLAQAIHVYRWRRHKGTAKARTRSEVKLTKSKWYRQKGTGRARHGAKSAHIFVGGGVAHGPKGVKRVLSLPAKMRKKALESALAAKLLKTDVVLAEFQGIDKTKKAAGLIKKIRDAEGSDERKVTVILAQKNMEFKGAFSNIDKVFVIGYREINAYTIYFGGQLVFDKEVFSKSASASKKNKKS